MNRRDLDRQEARAGALLQHAAAYEAARDKLVEIYEAGDRIRSQYAIRSALVHARRAGAAGSPPSSPAGALAPLKGWAMPLYLIAIFDAQSRRPAGATVDHARPLFRVGNGQAGWADLLPAITQTAPERAGMRRQAVHALNLLEREHLAVIAGRGGVAGRYDRVQFLDETGDGTRHRWLRRYSIPRSDSVGDVVHLPKAFFLNGWVHVLTVAEITTYLMILDLQARYPESGRDGVFKVAAQRVDRYGVRRDVYATHRQLAGYGLIRRLDDPARSPDGRIIKRSSPRYTRQPYRFRTFDSGFDRPALTIVSAHLRSQRSG
ncbi:hypothetical protein ACFPIJ_29230 [Dactylosporangium cerinum]|uniref:Uncharacterized protein n=1 Tax=Dactylosporangium cerinum TaxID=1434730 RepID=A0ABV9W3T1_9ACTN